MQNCSTFCYIFPFVPHTPCGHCQHQNFPPPHKHYSPGHGYCITQGQEKPPAGWRQLSQCHIQPPPGQQQGVLEGEESRKKGVGIP